MKYDILTPSDISAALIGYLFADQMNMNMKPSQQAAQSLVVSILARVTSETGITDFFGEMDSGSKNELIVGVLGAISSMYSKQGGALRGALTHMSIDLIAEDLIHILRIQDTGFFRGNEKDTKKPRGRRGKHFIEPG